MKRVVLAVLACLLVGAAVFLVPVLWFKPWTPDLFYGRVFVTFLLRHPMLLTNLGLLESTPFRWYADELDDASVQATRREARFAANNLRTLRSYDRRGMSEAERLSADVLDWYLADAVALQGEFLFHDLPVNQLFGIQSEMPKFLLSIQPLASERDARAYVTRAGKIARVFDQTIGQLALRDSLGIRPPRFVLRRVIAEMRAFAATPADSNPLVTHFEARADSVQGLSAKEAARLTARLRATVAESLVPSYLRLIAECERLEAKANDDDGVWRFPNGDAFYDRMLRHHTTTDLPADSIYALGLAEVERLQGEMRAILRELREPVEPFGAAVRRLRTSPDFGFPPGDEGRDRILARYREVLDDASTRSDSLFNRRPKSRLEVKRVPAFSEATSPGAYYNGGALDGSRAGAFFVNLRDPAETRRPDVRTLAYHEGIPGHHLQVSIARELTNVPFFRRVIPFTAYQEGWALYAERLALEHGFHRDAYDSLGAYGAELFRAVRLVVDTGIHRKRWNRRQAIDYMVANTGMDSSSVVTEIERYIVSPGQACAYKVGQLEILALRERARARLGERFDLRRFHDVVLANGALPLAVLERLVDEWVEREARASGLRARG